MTPSRRRPVVSYWHDAYRVSERRACRVARMAISTFRYTSVQEPRTALRLRIREIAQTRVRYGYRKIRVPLNREDRQRILRCNVTRRPTSTWIAQQLREAFPYQSAPEFLILDHDATYGWEVPSALRSMKIIPTRTSIRSPWQNGVAERWVGSCRRELLDHVILLNERHLRRLLSEYVSYYHEDRTHLGLRKERLAAEPVLRRPAR